MDRRRRRLTLKDYTGMKICTTSVGNYNAEALQE
jgi:hypothetical protein